MRESFYQLADRLTATVGGGDMLLLNYSAEASDFVRMNDSRVRQAGSVDQRFLSLELVRGRRHTTRAITLTGDADADFAKAAEALKHLDAHIADVPEDPYLLVNTEVHNSEQHGESNLPSVDDALDAILAAGEGRDLVGIYASGGIFRGFANSLGQRNWFSTYSFDLDWSYYARGDKAVKTSYAGFEWSDAEFQAKVAAAAEQLDLLGREPRTVEPGEYSVYLAPAALTELLEVMAWNAYGLKAQRTKRTCLLPMLEENRQLSPKVTIAENTAEGLAPNFTSAGFVRPARVQLIHEGELGESLVSPRSAKEYGETVNAGGEYPTSLDLGAGAIPRDNVTKKIGEGVYANQLWYLNFSDMPAGRITGMTRFATFWVEGGQIVAPMNVMRFDETIFRALGENLVGLTAERDFLPDAGTYGGRSTSSVRLPGAIIKDFRFTL